MASSGAFVVLILSMVSKLRSKWEREKQEREERKIPLPRAKSQRGRKFIPPALRLTCGGREEKERMQERNEGERGRGRRERENEGERTGGRYG